MMRAMPVVYKSFSPIIFSILLLLCACQKTDIQYGQQYIDNGLTNIILVDSISPAVSTVFKDSIITSQTGTAMAGSYTDPYFGTVSSSSFVQLTPSTNTLPDLLGNAQYDSIVVLLKNNGIYYGDTSLAATYYANQLTEEISLQDQSYFFNTRSFSVNASPLGSSALTAIRPAFKDTARIHLADGFGSTLFSMLKRKSDTLKTNTVFLNYFKGLKITAPNSHAVYGFKDSVTMRLYYHEADLNRQDKYFDFTLNSKALQFNNIIYDRSGTPLTILNSTKKEVASAQTGNSGYLQSATGLYIKVSFPTLNQLLQRPDFIQLVKAELIIKPIINSYSIPYPLPPQLQASVTDALNEPGGALTIGSGSATITQNGNLLQDPINKNNTSYSYDVTSYLAHELTVTGQNEDGLILIPPAAARSAAFDRLVIGDARNPNVNARIQLKVYYVSVIH
jgi:Domain of unknown function (DUF4270)